MTDITKTRIELVNEALGILTNLPSGTAFSDEDNATVDSYVDPVIAELAAEEVAYIDDADAIPSEIFLSLVAILASRCGPRYGQPRDADGEERNKRAIRKMVAGRPTYEPLETVCY
jgi:hypothetical protein